MASKADAELFTRGLRVYLEQFTTHKMSYKKPTFGGGNIEKKLLTTAAGSGQTCICDRPRMRLFCRTCGFTTNGRCSMPCQVHANVSYVMDYRHCPLCKLATLIEFDGSV